MTNKIVLIWFVIILLIANLSAMITVYYKTRKYSFYNPSRYQTTEAVNNVNIQPQPLIHLLKFNKEQIKKFQELRKDYHTALIDLNKDLHKIRQKIALELSSDSPDEKVLDKLAEDFGKIQVEIKQVSFKHFVQVKEICNDEQKRVFNSNINSVVERQKPGPGFRHRRQHGKK